MTDADTRLGRQRAERNGAAVLRALGRAPTAEFRGHHLSIADRPVAVASPHLSESEDPFRVPAPGVFDALGARLRYSDSALHRELEPSPILARVVFDMLEQLRCEAHIPAELEGARRNVEAAFRAWCDEENLTGTSVGLLLATVLHMARSRLVHPLQNERIEDTIEATRANLAPLIGHALKTLVAAVDDQRSYAEAALEIAAVIDDLVSDELDAPVTAGNDRTLALIVPPEWADGESDAPIAVDGPESDVRIDERSLDEVGDYRVFSRDFDRVLDGVDLYPATTLEASRTRLDEQVATQSVSVFNLARRLQRVIVGLERDGWHLGEEDGVLDGARLAQIVANPTERHVFRHERFRITSPAVVSFLIDNSGSMKRQRHETVAVLVDTLARALDLAGATSEILGFTTNSWNGGEPLRMWRRQGEPPAPGRIAELAHIVYKDADTPWKRSRASVAALMRTQHFRESVDGEAIAWAYQRLLDRPERRKLLVVVSDGAPMEAATINANGEGLLEAHLRAVVRRIERDGVVEIGAVSIDVPVDEFFTNHVDVDLDHTLTLASYRLLEELFGSRRHRRAW